MRRLLGIGAAALGTFGVLVCAVAIGLGWWTAVRIIDHTTRAASRLNHGLSEADSRLERVEKRLTVIRTDLAEARGEAERLAAENPELPRIRAMIERFLDRLLPMIDRAAALADSLRAVATGLRAVEDVVVQLGGEIEQPSRARIAADTIDRGAEVLNIPQSQIDAAKSAAAVRLTRELIELVRKAVAGSESLAEGLADARREITDMREQVDQRRVWVVFWVRIAAFAHTLAWVWIGLGQWCLIGWGRRFARRVPTAQSSSQPT